MKQAMGLRSNSDTGFRLDGKVVLSVGGSTGNKAKTAQLATGGAAKVAVAGLERALLPTPSAKSGRLAGPLSVCSLTFDEKAFADCVKQTVTTYGKLDGMQANAATTRKGALAKQM